MTSYEIFKRENIFKKPLGMYGIHKTMSSLDVVIFKWFRLRVYASKAQINISNDDWTLTLIQSSVLYHLHQTIADPLRTFFFYQSLWIFVQKHIICPEFVGVHFMCAINARNPIRWITRWKEFGIGARIGKLIIFQSMK